VEVARITAKGQITIPLEIRKKLNLKGGDKIIFFEEGNGRIFFENPDLLAFNRIQDVMRGAAKDAGFKNEQELQDFATEVRQEMWKKQSVCKKL
jgi:AbrB family looped-hinge helix DNA binding protein